MPIGHSEAVLCEPMKSTWLISLMDFNMGEVQTSVLHQFFEMCIFLTKIVENFMLSGMVPILLL